MTKYGERIDAYEKLADLNQVKELHAGEALFKANNALNLPQEPSLLAFSCEIRVRNYGERLEELEGKIRGMLM